MSRAFENRATGYGHRMGGDTEQAKQTLGAFLRRAERIMATTAAQREDLATIGSTMQVMLRVGQREQRIERSHLPEPELLEAAVMIRPVILQSEPVHLGKVTSAIRQLTQNAPASVQGLAREVKQQWFKQLSGERWVVMVAKAGEPRETRLTDVAIAELWFNAHVWHDDQEKQWALRHINRDECLISATVWVSDRVLMVRALQQLIVDWRTAGHIPG